MITTTYNYNTGSSFIYNVLYIGFSGGYASLLPINNPNQTFTPSISASTYDSSLLTYTSGSLKQVDQRPANATFYAAWASMLNANWSGNGNGSLVMTPFNSAAISGSVLNLTGSTDKYVTFSATGNADSVQTGTIEFEYTPNYSGTPATIQSMFAVGEMSGSYANAFEIIHYTDGHLYMDMWDITSTPIVSVQAVWNPVSGTTYTILCQYNGTSGTNSIYINGSLFATTTQTFSTRTSSISFGTIGGSIAGAAANANFSISNLSVYSTVLTPSSPTLPSTIYATATANLPEFTYNGIGSLQSWSGLLITDSNMPAYTFNGLYWNGTSWTTSSGIYAQANSASVAIANIATLPASNILQINAIYQASNNQANLSAMTVTYTGQIYPVDPTINPMIPVTMDALSAFSDVQSASGSDGIGWFLKIGSAYYWYNGSAWTTSNQTYAQSNTASQIQTNASTLPISLGAFVTPFAIIHSASRTTTPNLTSLTITYDYFGPPPPGPNLCTVYGYLNDESGNPIVGATMTVKNPTTFINQGIVEIQGLKTVTTDSIGYFEFNLYETTTVNMMLQWSVVYPFTGLPSNTFTFGSTLIPNTPEVNFSTLTFTPI